VRQGRQLVLAEAPPAGGDRLEAEARLGQERECGEEVADDAHGGSLARINTS